MNTLFNKMNTKVLADVLRFLDKLGAPLPEASLRMLKVSDDPCGMLRHHLDGSAGLVSKAPNAVGAFFIDGHIFTRVEDVLAIYFRHDLYRLMREGGEVDEVMGYFLGSLEYDGYKCFKGFRSTGEGMVVFVGGVNPGDLYNNVEKALDTMLGHLIEED
jgi:hypothetical protein